MWFLAPPKHCARLPLLVARRIDILRDRRRADEAHRRDIRIVENAVDRLLVAVDDIEDAGRQARFEEQFGKPHRAGRIALRGLHDEGVAAGDGRRRFPQRDHGREVERRDAGGHTQRLAHRIHVDAGAGAIAVFALQQMRDAAGEFDNLDTALQVAQRIGNGLAVLHGDQRGQFLGMGAGEFEEAHHHAGPHLRVLRRPFGLRRLGVFDRGPQFGGRCQRHPGRTSPVFGL